MGFSRIYIGSEVRLAVNTYPEYQRRRIKTEAKAKVVACVWGGEFIQFHAALAVLPRTILIMG